MEAIRRGRLRGAAAAGLLDSFLLNFRLDDRLGPESSWARRTSSIRNTRRGLQMKDCRNDICDQSGWAVLKVQRRACPLAFDEIFHSPVDMSDYGG